MTDAVYQLEYAIVRWAEERNLIKGSTPAKQLEKTAAELIELTVELGNRSSNEVLASELGDVLVTLIIVAHQLGLDFEECLGVAYNKIKDRKGKMVDGKFVKEADL